ncbi:MAG: hypothetical protein M1827_002855 [Pycnora praestabilis]|nr:MAG: hypothetical protein M1827_002855 [Pycnora praestabilis]
MPSALCCQSQRSSSPNVSNARHVEPSQPDSPYSRKKYYQSSAAPPHDSKANDDAYALKAIFAEASVPVGEPRDALQILRRDSVSEGDASNHLVRHRSSASRIRNVKTRIRKTLSRESGLSRRSSRRKTREESSEEEIERRHELRRALRRRLQEEILADKGVGQGGYDSDANILATPKSLDESVIEDTHPRPKELGKALLELRKSEDVVQQVKNDHDTQFRGLIHEKEDSFAWNLPPMERGRHPESPRGGSPEKLEALLGNRDDSAIGTGSLLDPHSRREFMDNISNPGTPTSLSRNSTFRSRVQSVEQQSARISSLPSTEPQALTVQPPRLPHLPGSVAEGIWRLSYAAHQRRSSMPRSISSGGQTMSQKDLDGTRMCPLPHSRFLKSARSRPGLRGFSFLSESLLNTEVQSLAPHSAVCNASNEEKDFGGVDGSEDGFRPEDRAVSNYIDAKPTVPYEGYDNGEQKDMGHVRSQPSVHLTDMRISQRLASRSLLTATSLPQLSLYRNHEGSKSSSGGTSIHALRLRHNRKAPSSGLESVEIPTTWENLLTGSGSSIYPSQANSRTLSSKSSRAHIPLVLDSFERGHSYSSDDSTDLSAFMRQRLDIDMDEMNEIRGRGFRRRTLASLNDSETLLYSETDSFRARELVANMTRFAGKGNVLSSPRASRFLEELSLPLPDLDFPADGLITSRRVHSHSATSGLSARERDTEHTTQCSKGESESYDYHQNASTHWNRALSVYAGDKATHMSKSRLSISVNENLSREDSSPCQSHQVVDIRDVVRAASHVNTLVADDGMSAHDDGNPKMAKDPHYVGSKTTKHGVLKRPPPATAVSWSHYPSHTRHSRTSSAGDPDKVVARDFAPSTDDRIYHEGVFGVRMTSRNRKKKKKFLSMPFSKHKIRTWGRLYRSQSTDFDRRGAGHRSSIATGGLLKHPELEIVPTRLPIEGWQSLQQLPLSIDTRLSSQREACQSEEEGERGEIQHEGKGHGMSSGEHFSARIWSQLYEDCIDFPSDTEDASMTDTGSTNDQPVSPSAGRGRSRRRNASGPSEGDLRGSTNESKENVGDQ